MSASAVPRSRAVLFRWSGWDGLLVALALGHGVLLLDVPSTPLVALGLWWNSNTIAHNFIHKPFFTHRLLNRLFGLYLTLLLGVPQTLWRDRHLAHHAGVAWKRRVTTQLLVEVVLVLSLWAVLVAVAPGFFLTAYVPGYLAGLALCWLHGYYEHARGTISHHGHLYNMLFFNDGYHVEHHANPGRHWTELPAHAEPTGEVSRWPPVFRWMEVFSLGWLEHRVARSPWLQRFVLARHEAALRALLPQVGEVTRVGIVGGGLWPRTALLLQRLLPGVRLTIIDASDENITTARAVLRGEVEWVNEWFDPVRHGGYDLLVFPLAYVGDRSALYARPPAKAVLVHDWLWRYWPTSERVSLLLLKRVNLVTR